MLSDKQQQKQQQYEAYVSSVTPSHSLALNMGKAFITGGIICTIGQIIFNTASSLGADPEASKAWCSIVLIFLSVLLTGLNCYWRIGRFAGAGALVPITGFANSVASPAIEFQAEGQIFGIGCKIFTIAGPVILYGIFTTWIMGLLYYILKITEVITL